MNADGKSVRAALDAPLERFASAATVAAAGLVALVIAMGIGRFAYTPILPMMLDDAGLSVAAGGWLASANYIGYLLGAMSAIALRLAPRWVIRGALVGVAFTTFAMGLAQHLAAWLALRLVTGIASAWVLVFVSAWCMERLALLQRPGLNGAVFAGVGTGIAIVGALCLVLMRLQLDSGTAWMTFGAFAFALTLAVWPVFAANGKAPSNAPHKTRFPWNRESLRLVICYGVFGFGYIIPATFLPAMAKQVVADPMIFGWSWPLFGAAALLSTLLTGALHRLMTNRRLWIIGHLVMAAGAALPAVWNGIAAILLAALCVGATFMVITMVALQEAREVGGAAATSLIASMTTAIAVGQIVGPVSAGYAVTLWGNFTVPLLCASVMLVLSAAALRNSPKD